MTLKIRIATRKSELALRQVDIVKSYFGEDVETETIKVTTSGDKILINLYLTLEVKVFLLRN